MQGLTITEVVAEGAASLLLGAAKHISPQAPRTRTKEKEEEIK